MTRTKINKTENRKATEKKAVENWFFEKLNKTDKHLVG